MTKGLFPNVHELVAGYWIWKVHDLNEAIEQVKCCPNPIPDRLSSKSARFMRRKILIDQSKDESPRRGRLYATA